ncbi:hypothetical protein RhiirC2_782350 [Rhizophagus irregularis]|uniref:Uncharacterized protein n=1 Tax=Rhizophagus irregularis TaxID=588596 RepID=A0A2N1N3A8_9GLOM|nr:hypothetical protein RhiirC2_782350 [Rhizophagus irregularis]
MTSNTNNNSDQDDTQLYNERHEELLYEVLLYKKKDIIAIQEKLGMAMESLSRPHPSINGNINQTALNQSKKKKTLKDSFGLLFNLVEELKLIHEKIDICGPMSNNFPTTFFPTYPLPDNDYLTRHIPECTIFY